MGDGRRLALVLATLAGASLLLGACDKLFPKRSAGEELWRSRCANCHGYDGRGNTAQYIGNYKADLIDNSWEHGPDPGSWELVIREGVFGSMPANPDLDNEQVKALVQYLRQLRGETPYR
jgi:mono/diheme cytochrome c family protein